MSQRSASVNLSGRISRAGFKQLLQNLLMAAFLLALFCIGFRLWPHPPLSEGLPLSTAYYDRQGTLLRLTLSNDDRYRLWTPLEEISPLAVEGIMRYEDRWFYCHPGFNPYSLLRGFWVSYVSGGRLQGGSTLTMQLARMHWRLNTRTLDGKAVQILRAVQLELSYSKRDILEAYLNYAPYGRNVESIGAASLIYFNKAPKNLTLPEALTLAVLPQSPSYRVDANTGVVGTALTDARNRLYQSWLAEHPEDADLSALFHLPLALRQPEKNALYRPASGRTNSKAKTAQRRAGANRHHHAGRPTSAAGGKAGQCVYRTQSKQRHSQRRRAVSRRSRYGSAGDGRVRRLLQSPNSGTGQRHRRQTFLQVRR
ncbi:Penicillin-binding protein 1A [Leminorella grimontii]|nr:Penicillin-binding protein 1A [Leminorella grimontii]